MTPIKNTPVFPTNAEAITAGATIFKPSTIWADVGGTITVIPADAANDADTVSFVVPNSGTVPCLCRGVTAVVSASGLKRIF